MGGDNGFDQIGGLKIFSNAAWTFRLQCRRQDKNRTIGIKSKQDFFGELERDWLAIDKGKKPPKPIHRIYFESAEVLSKVITRQRHNLLKVLHANGPLIIRDELETMDFSDVSD